MQTCLNIFIFYFAIIATCDTRFLRALFATPLVTVYNSTDTANGIPHEDGDFKIIGLKEGTYSIIFKGCNGYRDTALLNVQLKNGEEKTSPAIT